MKIISKMPWWFFILRWKFNIPEDKVHIAFGDRIYSKQELSPDKEVHEQVHFEQQKNSYWFAYIWWLAYIILPNFRFNEELEAYQTEYQFIKKNAPIQYRETLLNQMAEDLASPFYGSLETEENAKLLIKGLPSTTNIFVDKAAQSSLESEIK